MQFQFCWNKLLEYTQDLEKLAESFSSDVINEAISEIVAEEDGKVQYLLANGLFLRVDLYLF